MKKAIHILIVADSATDAQSAKRAIARTLKGCSFHSVETRKDFLKALETFQPDVILSDYALPHFDGITALKLAHIHAPFTPLIIWTSSCSEDVAVECMKAGASNYVLKENIKRLGPAVIHALEERELLLARKQAEEKYQAIFEHSIVGIFQSTPQGRFQTANAALARIYGYESPEEMIETITDITQQIYVDVDRRAEFIRSLNAQDIIEFYEERNYRKDRSIIWTSTSARTVRDPNGNVLYYEGFVTDITARKEIEEKLKERERQLRILFGNLPGPVYRCRNDASYTMEFISDSIKELSGYAAEDFQEHRRDFGSLIHSQDRELAWADIQSALQSNQPFELTYRIITASGEEKWVWEKGQGVYDPKGELQALEGFITDVTKRKKAEEALRNNEKRYRALFENLPISIWEEDFSKVKEYLDSLRQQGITDFREYFSTHPESVNQCADGIRVLGVNNATLKMYQANNREALLEKINQERSQSQLEYLREAFISIAEGETSFVWEGVDKTITGEPIRINIAVSVIPGYEKALSKVIVSMTDITENKQAEEALRNSEKRFRVLMENGLDDISLLAADGTLLWESPSTVRNLGYAPGEYLAHNIFEIMHPDDLASTRNEFAKLIQKPGGRESGIFRLRRSDGAWRWVEAIATNFLNEPGINAVVINYRDITERKQIEEALREERNLLRILIDNIPDRIYAMDSQGRKTLSNTADWQACGGKTMEDIIGKTDFDTYSPDLAEEFWRLDKAVLESGQAVINYEEPGRDAQGNRVSILTTKIPLRDEEGKVIGLVGIGRDITERKQVEARMNDLLAFNEKILNHSAVGILTYQVTGQCVFANEKAASIVGTSVAQLLSQNFRTIESWKKSGLYHLVEKAITTQTPVTADIHHLSTFEKDVWMTVHCITFKSKGEDHLLLSISEITERKETEEKLRYSENRYRLATKATNDVIWESNLQTKQLFWSENAQLVFGYSLEEVSSHETWWEDHLHPDDYARVLSKINSLIEGDGSLWLEEYRFLLKDGSYAYISDRGYIERDTNGAPLRMIGAMTDITERKQAETERQALLEITQGLANTEDRKELLELIHRSIARVIFAKNFFVVLYQPDTGLFEEIYSVDQYDPPAPPAKLEDSITSYVFRSGEPLLLTQTLFDELVKQGEMKLIGTNSASWLGVPLKTSGRTIGVMAVQDYEIDNRYTERDRDFLASIATQVALVIERKQADIQLQQKNDDLGLLNAINEAVVQGQGLDPIIDLLGKEISRIFSNQGSKVYSTMYMLSPDKQSIKMQQYYFSSEAARRIEKLIGFSIPMIDIPIRKGGHFHRAMVSRRSAITTKPEEIRSWISEFTETSFLHPFARTAVRKLIPQIHKILNIKSVVVIPLIYGEETIGFWDVSSSGILTANDQKRIEHIAGQLTAVIQHQQANEKIRRSEEFLQSVQNALSANLAILDETGTIVQVNSAWREFGKQNGLKHPQACIGLNYLEICDSATGARADKASSVAQAIRAVISRQSSEARIEYPCHSPDVQRWFTLHITKFEDGHHKWVVLAHEDITERKRAEEALRESEEHYRAIFEGVQDAIFVESLDGQILMVNQRACEMFGYTQAEFLTRTVRDIVPEGHLILMADGEDSFLSSEPRETLNKRANGEIFPIDISGRLQVINGEKVLLVVVRDITERKQAEESLRAERRKIQNYLDIAGVMLLALDQEGTVTLINQKGCEILGFSTEEIIGKNWIKTFLPESTREEMQEVFQQLTSGSPQPKPYYENSVLTSHGEERLIAWHNTLVRDDQGKIVSTLSSGEDITERRRAEEALREAEIKYRTLVEQLPAVTYLDVIDGSLNSGEFNTSYISPQVEGLLGYPPHVFHLDRSLWSSLIHPEDRERVLAKIAEYYKNPSFYNDEYRMRTCKGNEIWVRDEAITVRAGGDRPPFSQGVIFDITERKRAETALMESNAKFRTLFEASPDAIMLIDQCDNWPIVDCNMAACQMNGYTREELIGQPIDILNLQPSNPQGRAAYMAEIQKMGVYRVEATHRRKDGTTFPVDISTSLITLGGRELVLGIDRDITERKRMEAAEREQRALAEALRDTAEILSSTLDYGEVLDHILMTVGQVVPHEAATIMLIDGESARVVRSRGYNQRSFNAELIGITIPLAETSNLRKMLTTRQSEVVSDTSTYAGWKQLSVADWLRSNVGAPISIYGKVIGFILLDSGTPGFFTPVHAERLEAFANQAALAIHNARLLQQAQAEIAERKRAEEELRLEKERIDSIAATVPGIICSFRLRPDGSACMPFASPAIQDVYGVLPTDVQQDATLLFERLHPDDLARVKAAIDESACTMLPWHAEFRYQHPTKGQIWIEGQAVPLLEEDGSMIWHGFIHDVTERKRAEEELRASEERFRQLADNIQEVFWMTDAESGKEIYMSPAAQAIWGAPLETLMYEPNTFINSVFPEDQSLVLQNLEKEKNGEKVEMEYRIVRPDGSLRWVWDRAFPIFDDAGQVKRIAGISADITGRKQAEKSLRESEERYHGLFQNLVDGFALHEILTDDQGEPVDYIFLEVNPAFEKLTGLNAAALIGQRVTEVLPGVRNERFIPIYGQVALTGTPVHFEEYSGPLQKYFEINAYSPKRGQFAVTFVDITERKQAEAEIRRRAEENSILLKTSLALTDLDLNATLQTVGDSAKDLFAADGCRIFLMEPDGKSLRCVLALQENLAVFSDLIIRVGEGVTGAVAASGQAEIVNEMENDPRSVQVVGTPEEEEAIMFAPLKERDNTVGVLSVRRTGGGRPFEPSDLALLEALASMAASAVSNARLFAETQRRLSELEALYENGLAVGRLLKPSEIGKRLIHTFARYLPWHHVTIRLQREASDDLELVAFSLPNLKEEERADAEQHFIARINKVGQGLSGWVIQTGVPLRTGNVHDYPQYIDTHAGIQSGLYMPLKVGERVIGVITVESELPEAFTEQDERLLATLASQAAIAFENARLYQEIEQELSERKRAQEALLVSETHYRELADSITDILFELDQDLRYTHWNKASETFSGISAAHAIGRSMRELFGTSEEQTRREEIYRSVLKEQRARTFETEVLAKGEKRALEINAYPSARGMSVVAKDVTDRKRAEIIMQKRFELMEYSAHHQLDDLMQKTVDEVSELTGSTIGFFHFVQEDQKTLGMQTWSTNALKLFPVSVSEETHLPLDQAGLWAEAVRQRRSLIQNNYEALPGREGLSQDQVPIKREIVIPIIRNERVMAVMGIGNKPQEYTYYDLEVAERLADYAWDITERKQMQIALEMERNQLAKRVEERTSDLSQANSNLARALRVKDEFLANMSHELRTPLNAILGLSESLGEQIAGPLNEKQQKYITTISESGHHLLSLINDILDLAKIEAGQITLDINKVDIHQVCQASLRMIKQLALKKNQDVVLEIGQEVGLMWADERRLKQMIVNLLGNAVKFTPENGKLGLEVHGDQFANKVTITVWDNGIGIKEVDLTRLFQPFVQLDSGLAREATGTGLGLALVAQMARLHGGSVSAASEPGKGSRFSILLPWEPALAIDTTSRLRTTGKFRAIKPDETNKPTILLVEDTKEVVMMIRDYLELAGYKVIVAQDGVEAIAQARLVHPDLFLMDVMMPRMDGFEATRKLRSEPEFKYTPIIALTALAMPSDRERCLAAGMDEYISKPVNLKALVRVIQSCLFNSKEPKPG